MHAEENRQPVSATHRLAARREWPWFPTPQVGILAPHPFCTDCGHLKFLGSSRALDTGGVANLLARLSLLLDRTGLRLTQAQVRLLLKRLEGDNLTDGFSMSRTSQESHLVALLSRSLGCTEEVVRSYLRSC